jgi:two-component system chemotaxis sensor kinase CheA
VTAKPSKSKSTRKTKVHREFVSEAEEILERMSEDLADLMDQRGELARGGEVDPELVNRIFRAAHSLKGLAGMFGLEGMSGLAHHVEDVLDGLRLGRVSFDAPAVGLLDEAVALFHTLLERVGDAAFEPEGSEAIADLVRRIEGSVNQETPESDELAELDLDPALLRALTEYEEHRLRENLGRGRTISLVDTTFEIISFEDGLAELSSAVREVGEVVSTLPSPGDAPESQIRFSLLAATDIDSDQMAARLEFPDTTVRLVKSGSKSRPEPSSPPAEATAPVATQEAPAPAQDAKPGGSGEEAQAPPGPAPVGESPEIESLKSISDTVRVDIRKLDELMNMVGELVIQRSAIDQIASRLCEDMATARIGGELNKIQKALDRKLKELQAGVLDVRMVPLRQIFEKLSRVVRRLRRDLEKDVNLECHGADNELDKLIVEQLVDPLMHVVRNAFDHAIETEEERRAVGKSAQGRIEISAFQRGNHVVIEVSDDGRGIDPEKVRASAVARGLLSPDAVVSDKEVLALVFEPGFSTRDEVSETSGRGVGMDVVRTNLVALGGMVELKSDVGRGTTLTMTLPITLAIIQALIVGVDDQCYAIPLNSVLETLLVESGEIQHSQGREMLNLRGEALPLRRLSEEFQLSPADPGAKQYVVVLGLGERRMGLLVDRLEGQQDTVIKPIHGPIQRVRGIAGATEFGDEGAILVIDVASIVDGVVRRREAA